MMKLASFNPKTHMPIYDKHRIVSEGEILRHGWYFKTFNDEEYVYIGNDLVLKIYKSPAKQIKEHPVPKPLAEILSYVKQIRNRDTQLIYGRKYPGQQLRKISIQKKNRKSS
ncbi:hypothetical protein ACFPVV_07130 [Macrococcoides bohemicum]|nr:hypothetical protein [Macrococcus bohemicus]